MLDDNFPSMDYIEFELPPEPRFEKLKMLIAALSQAKKNGDFKDDDHWLEYLDKEAHDFFWWPTEQELKEYWDKWYATPVDERLKNPEFFENWDFSSMIDAVKNGEYELIGCKKMDGATARLEFQTFAWPFGGTSCMIAMIDAFGGTVLLDSTA